MSKLAIEYIAIVVVYFAYVLACSTIRYKRYFAYCDGNRRNVICKERVSRRQWNRYDEYVRYPVLGMTKDTIYFLIDQK